MSAPTMSTPLKRLACLAGAAAISLLLGIAAGTSAAWADSGESTQAWSAPTTSRSVGKTVSTGARMGGETMAEMLGLNTTGMCTTRAGMTPDITLDAAERNAKLGVFGSDANESPDPYFYNYFYNLQADDAHKSVDAITTTANYSNGPARLIVEWDNAGTTVDLVKRPKVLLGTYTPAMATAPVKFVEGSTSAKNWSTWAGFKYFIADIRSHTGNAGLVGTPNSDGNAYTTSAYYQSGDESYDPIGVAYDGSSLNALVETTYDLAQAAEAAEEDYVLSTRYEETPSQIAQDYERYVKGTKWYVLSKIADGTVAKRTVAVVYRVNADGTFRLAVLNPDGDTSSLGSQRVAEAVQGTVNDLATTVDAAAKGGDLVDVTAAQLMKADVIVCENGSAIESMYANATNVRAALAKAGYADEATLPRIFDDVLPTGTAELNSASQTSEAAQLVGLLQGYVYPEILNSKDMLCYFFQEFYHLKASSLDTALGQMCAGVTFADGVDLSSAGYDHDSVADLLEAGATYYYENETAIVAQRPKLAATVELDAAYGHLGLSNATVAAIPAQTCTGKAITPAVEVTYQVGSSTRKLAQGTDYTVSYESNVYPGTATVTITGTGSYIGSATATFDIGLAKAKSVKARASGSRALKVMWGKVAGAQRYVVSYRIKGTGTWKNSKTTAKNSLVLKKLKKGKRYQVRVVSKRGAFQSTSAVKVSGKVR